MLQVKFNNRASLEEILRHVTFGHDTIPNRLCEACSSYSDTDCICQLVLEPDILVLHLARFTNMSGSVYKKNNAVIPFNEELDLSPFTKGKLSLKYRLLSVVQHRGAREQGHYITIARAPSGPWMKLDDEVASPAAGTDPFGQQDEDDEGPLTPYVLFWAKVDQNEIKEPPTKTHVDTTSADIDDELQPVKITINSVEKSKLAKPKQHHRKDDNEDGLCSLQISINGIQQPPSAKHPAKKSFSTILSQQDVEEIYTHMSKNLLASEMREMGEVQKTELEKVETLRVNGEVEEGGRKKESQGQKDGKDGKEDEDEEGDREEKQEKHEDEEEKEGEQQQQQEKKHEKVSCNKRQKPDDHITPDPKLDNFPNRQKSPNKINSSQDTKPKGDSEEQTPSDDEASKTLVPKRAQAEKKRRKKKKRNRC